MPPSWESRFRGQVAGIIEAGVAVRATTSELWTEIRGSTTEAGVPITNRGFALVRQMRKEAVARRKGYERFQAADPQQAFTTTMAAPDMNVRSAMVRDVSPEYLVRFDLTFAGPDGTPTTRTVSVHDIWRPGMTVGDVQDSVAEAAEGLALDYGQGLIDFANLRPVMI